MINAVVTKRNMFRGLLFFLITLSLLIYSEFFAKWLLSRTITLEETQITLTGVSGSVTQPLTFKTIIVTQPHQNIELNDVTVDCHWLRLVIGALDCSVIQIASARFEQDASEASTSKPLPDLAQLSVASPVAIAIKSVQINQLEIAADNRSAFGEQLTNIEGEKITLTEDRLSIGSLVFSFREHQVKLSTKLQLSKQWQHNVDVTVSGHQLNVALHSQGDLLSKAQYQLTIKQPQMAQLSGQWFWQQGVFIEQGILTSAALVGKFDEQPIALNNLQANYRLHWPTFELTSSANLSSQPLDKLTATLDVQIPDVLNWLKRVEGNFSIKSTLTANELHRLGALMLKEKFTVPPITQQTIDVDMAANFTIDQGIAKFTTTAAQFGDLSLTLASEFDLEQQNLNMLVADLSGDLLLLPQVLTLAQIEAKTRISHEHGQWQIISNGKAKNVTTQQGSGQDITWLIDVNEHWQINASARALKVAGQDVDHLDISMQGQQADHQVILALQSNSYGAGRVEFNGAYLPKTTLASSTEQYQITQLFGQLTFLESMLTISATDISLTDAQQRMTDLCINGLGKLCLSAQLNSEAITAAIDAEQWQLSDTQPLIQLANQVFLAQPAFADWQLVGQLSGQMTIDLKDNQPTSMRGNFMLPSLSLSASNSAALALTLEQVALLATPENDLTKILMNWQSLKAEHGFEQVPYAWTASKGQVDINVKTLEHISTRLIQEQLAIALPDNIGDPMGKITQLSMPLVNVQHQFANGQQQIRLTLNLPEQDQAHLQLSSPWPLTSQTTISGDVKLELAHFEWLKAFMPELDQIAMQLQQSFKISGKLAAPQFDGSGKLTVNDLVIEEFGVSIKDSFIDLTSAGDRFSYHGELFNGQGKLAINGTATLSDVPDAKFNVTGNKITVVNSNDNKLIVSPNLQASINPEHIKISGNVVIDEGDISVKSLPKQAIRVSEDQVIVGQVKHENSNFLYDVDVKFITGSDVDLSVMGLTSKVSGQLQSTLKPQQPLSLNGKVLLTQGKFTFYHQELMIEEGQLLFLGNAENPGLQFKAVREIEGIKVGVIADGTVNQPKLTLYSEPYMSQEDILAMLILGRKIEDLSQSEGSALSQVALNLGLEEANKLVRTIGQKFGLKDVSISSKSKDNGTRVDIAAKVNDRLNVGYGTMLDADNSVQSGWIIEYRLSPHISFEAVSGEEFSATLNYKKQFSRAKDDDDGSQ